METHRAQLRSFLSDNDVSAVAANPHGVAFSREDNAFLYIGEQTAVAFLMVALDRCYSAEFLGDVGESFFVGFLCHALIHVGPLVVFSCSGIAQVVHCTGHFAAMKQLEPKFGMFFFVVGGFLKDGRDLFVAVFTCF